MTGGGVLGVTAMKLRLQQAAAGFSDRLKAAVYQEAQIILAESKRRCPVARDGGILNASALVSEPEINGKNVSVTMSYGGAASEYAIAVHETPSEHDPPSWVIMYQKGSMIQWTTPGTGPKFLEGPINEAVPTMAARLAARLEL